MVSGVRGFPPHSRPFPPFLFSRCWHGLAVVGRDGRTDGVDASVMALAPSHTIPPQEELFSLFGSGFPLLLFGTVVFAFLFSNLVVPLVGSVGGLLVSGDMMDRHTGLRRGGTRRVTRLGSSWSVGRWSYARLMKYCAVVWDTLVLFRPLGPSPRTSPFQV